MRCGKAEDAGGLMPVKDGSAVHTTTAGLDRFSFVIADSFNPDLQTAAPLCVRQSLPGTPLHTAGP